MADLICRWRNPSVSQVLEFNNVLPKQLLESKKGREYTNANWNMLAHTDFFTTPYQLAAQLGLYYEDKTHMYPRFNNLISVKEAWDYMKCWGMKYYVPNPYTKSIKTRTTPIVLNNYLVNWAIEHENASLSEALEHAFGEKLGNLDILINALNGFSEVTIKDDIITLKDKSQTNKYPDNEVWLEVDPNDKKYFFEYISNEQYAGDAPKEIAAFQEYSGGMPAILAKSITTALQIDDNLKLLSSCWSSNKDGDRLYIGMLCFAVELNKALTLRDGDTNKEVVWQWNGKTYCISNEISFHRFKDFIEAYNETYAGQLKIVVKKEDGKNVYILYQLTPHIKCQINSFFASYLTALRTKPFMLLAGISGTGKSRIVREMAKACWKEGDEEYGKNNPRNFCMVQVKPNWHDSTELLGYVSRINGEKYVVGPFLRFLAAAIKEPEVPYFLCLDEMNLAPVEQYFAEYLSVIESRKLNEDGTITTDPIIKPEDTQEYHDLIGKLFGDEERLKGATLTIPQNLFVVGTVNMDETTFSFSRKVLDRAMTIELNEVDLHGGLEKGAGNEIGYIGNSIIGTAAEGCDIYEDNRELCDQVLAYLVKVNTALEGTPFKIAYRTRNEFLMYVVNRKTLAPESQLWQTLDEMTSMKILSRIEGDIDRTKRPLEELKKLVEEYIVSKIVPNADETSALPGSISATKIDEMLRKLQSTSFTSYWA